MINNRNSAVGPGRLTVRQSVLYDCAGTGWTYSHHASLAYFQNRFYAMWSNGRVHEDEVDQRVLMATSSDGVTWSEPTELFPPVAGNGVLTAAGWYVREDGILNAYAGLYYYPTPKRPNVNADHLGTTLLCRQSVDGAVWSQPQDLRIPIIPNQGPHRLQSGRLMIDGNVTFPWTDDPKGLDGWTVAGIPPCPVEGLQDDSEGFHKQALLRGETAAHVCEGSHFQTEDGVLHMLLRDTSAPVGEKHLYLSESRDNAVSWSDPVKLDFTDNGTKFYCLRLQSGRFAVIGSPDQTGRRCPLSVLLSEDGENFASRYDVAVEEVAQKYEGFHKGGIYGYPHAIEVSGTVYVICSINKEDIRVFAFPADELCGN